MFGFVFMVGAAAVAAVTLFGARKRQLARIARATGLAAQYGFQIDVARKPPPAQQFDLFSIGRSKNVTFQIWRPGERDSAFEYKYTTGSGKNSHTYRHTCAMISLPFAAPHTKIGPEGFWSGIGRAIGVRDIEVESSQFNDQYRVTSDDERFAIALLDQQMIGWMLSSSSGSGSVKFEIWGSWLLCISSPIEIEQMFGFVDWAQSVRTAMPVVLASLYPLP